MNMRQVIIAALRKDPDLVPKVAGTLRERIDEKDGRMSTVVQSAAALEPIIRRAVRKRPSKLGTLGLRSAHLLATLAAEDVRSSGRLASIAEKGTVGIVFVDVADFTVLTAELGDEAAIDLLTDLNDLIVRAIKPGRGELVKSLGDGFLLAFPSASQAVRGANGIRKAIEKKRKAIAGWPLSLRIAVHAGEPLIEQDDLLGHDVNLTARLLDHCKPDEIIVSEAAKELAEKRLRTIDFGRRRLVKIRGLSSKTVVFSI
ncbi:MAG TPA: adenylate/guanylate cyclase domain-containing protein [Actinomycetota bacterium]|nr:adenylate/guanylate cyclase domain-containing protein [Actinomycetota bacterium]